MQATSSTGVKADALPLGDPEPAGASGCSTVLRGCGFAMLAGCVIVLAFVLFIRSTAPGEETGSVRWARPPASEGDRRVSVVYATATLPLGCELERRHLEVRRVLERDLPGPEFASSLEQAVGTVARRAIYPGEPIVAPRVETKQRWKGIRYLVAPGRVGVPLVLPPAARGGKVLWVDPAGPRPDGSRFAVVEVAPEEVTSLLRASRAVGFASVEPAIGGSALVTGPAGDAVHAARAARPVADDEANLVSVVDFEAYAGPGRRIDKAFLKRRRLPEDLLPRYTALDLKDVLGKVVVEPVYRGEPASLMRFAEPEEYDVRFGVAVDARSCITSVRLDNGAAVALCVVSGEGVDLVALGPDGSVPSDPWRGVLLASKSEPAAGARRTDPGAVHVLMRKEAARDLESALRNPGMQLYAVLRNPRPQAL